MNIANYLDRAEQAHPDRVALLFEGQTLSYRGLARQVNHTANNLEQWGVGKGDRVALFLPNVPGFIIVYLATLKVGAIAVSLNAQLKEQEIALVLEDCTPKVIATTAALHDELPPLTPSVEQLFIVEGELPDLPTLAEQRSQQTTYPTRAMAKDDPAAIVYSSGTTGYPKGVTLSHNNVLSNIEAKKQCCGMRADDRALLFVPLYHCFGQNAVMNSILYSGGTVVLQRKFELEQILRTITDEQITMFFAVPTVFILLLHRATPEQLQSVRYFFSAAAKLPLEISWQWQERFGARIYEGYGLSESSPFACYNHRTGYRIGSIGTPIEQVEMQIVDLDSGEALAPGELGEIVIRGPNVMLGYWKRPDATAKAIRDGWLHTGDIGYMDADGYFYIVDRLNDMINVAGMKVYPAEVENVIYQHPAVDEVAVFGQPDPVTGERVEAHVVVRQGDSVREDALLSLCRKKIATFKVPSKIHFVRSLPKSATGKILKRELRQEGLSTQS